MKIKIVLRKSKKETKTVLLEDMTCQYDNMQLFIVRRGIYTKKKNEE